MSGSGSSFVGRRSVAVVVIAVVLALLVFGVGAGAAVTGPLYFDATVLSAGGPPYPTSPVKWSVTAAMPPDPCFPPSPCTDVETISLSLSNALGPPPDDQLPVPMSLVATDSGGRLGAGTQGKADFMYPDPGPPGSFDIYVALAPLGRSTPRLTTPPSDNYPDPGPPNSFDVTFTTETAEGTASHTLHFEIGAEQPFTFTDIVVGPPQSPAFHITFNLTDDGSGGTPSSDTPLYTSTLTGDFTPTSDGGGNEIPEYPTAAVPAAIAAAGYLALRKKRDKKE